MRKFDANTLGHSPPNSTQPKKKVNIKRIARQKAQDDAQAQDTEMLAFESKVGFKRPGILESLESEENRIQKCLFHAPSPPFPWYIGGGCHAALQRAMITLGWNYRGLMNPQTVRVLREFMQWLNPTIVFFTETKLNKKEAKKRRRSMSHLNCLFVPSKGQSGGLAMI